ncbi:cullin-3-B-like [Macrosteles quadrilineatus]|uniref:cullin-3-B-like n=1 Tax=Macrosteles quadrilineatus TaxID=74068 RepID=UPI0023E0FB81|nr:cullin-3-B-like [Macrosteles quadrilineatus]
MSQEVNVQVNNEGSKLGLYHVKNVSEPNYVMGIGDHAQLMDRNTAEHMWQLLRNAIQQIQTERLQDLDFELLYRYGYYLVLNKYGGMLYNGLRDEISHHVTHKVRSRVLTNLNNNFLQVMTSSWDIHQMSLLTIRDILMYLDRVYVKNHGVDDIYTLGLNLFKDQVVQYSSIQTFLQSKLLDLVMTERQGDVIDRPIFRDTTRMLMVLGNKTPEVYQVNFETPFLQQSIAFFKSESQRMIVQGNTADYLRNAMQYICRESERADGCFDEITKPKIVKVVEDELISTNLKQIVEMPESGVVHMMGNQLTEDLKMMYQLLSRVPEGLRVMFESMSGYLRQQGCEIMVNQEPKPVNIIERLLEIKQFTDYFLANSFSNDKFCKQMIALDFEYVLNINSKSPEYLSLFIDDRLKKCANGFNYEDKAVLENTVELFRFLRDKDMFEQFYKQHLAKRLLLNKTISEEQEMAFIGKLRTECGLQYTRKMEGMFRDILNSSEITAEFQNHVTDTWDPITGVELSVRLLTAGFWPMIDILPPCRLPSHTQTAYDSFKQFYLSRHCGRQLTLLPQLGSAEMKASFQGKEYTLPVSTYQMCILMLFNIKSHWTLQGLQENTKIPMKDLLRSLQSLSSGKSFQKILNRSASPSQGHLDDVFSVNETLSSKGSRIKLPQVQIKFEATGDPDRMTRIIEERKHEVEAAVMRILKARKTAKHDMLTNEVIKMLSPRFMASKEFIKIRIEDLIERGFIVRSKKDRRVYEYVA